MLALDVGGDGVVDAVAADSDRVGDDHPRKGDHRDLGGAATDIADGVPAGLVDRQVGADRGSQGLVDQPRLLGAGGDRRLGDGAPLHGGDTRGHADHHLGLEDALATLHPGDEVVQHAFGRHEVGDDSIAHRAHDLDALRGTTHHLACLGADRQDPGAVPIHCDQAGLVDDYALASDIHEHGAGAQIYPDFLC